MQSADSQSSDTQSAETAMRRALGLSAASTGHTPQQRPEQARQRHRFVQDGGVPVVMLNHKPEPETAALRERIAALEASLDGERAAHNATKRTLHEQQAQAQALQTRLAHSDLAHAEALDAERALRMAAQEALARAEAMPAPRKMRASESVVSVVDADASVVEAPLVARPETAVTPKARPTKAAAAKAVPVGEAAPKAKRGRPRINPIPEPKPVRWWTPSFRAKTKA